MQDNLAVWSGRELSIIFVASSSTYNLIKMRGLNWIFYPLLLLVFVVDCPAQNGGREVFTFLNLPVSPRISALGGNLITVVDDDVNLAFHNPASLNPSVHTQISFNHNFHIGDIQHGSAYYGHHFNKPNLTFFGGVNYVNYGDLVERDVFGVDLGTFKARDLVATVGASYQIEDRLSVGANVKWINSDLGRFQSSALATDLAASYIDTSRQIVATLLFKHVGVQLTPFAPGTNEELPFEIQFGVSKRLRYLPFRFSIIYQYLDRWNVLYEDPNEEQSIIQFGEQTNEQSDAEVWLDNFFRHFVFNGAFLLGKKDNFRIRFGYNHLMRKELTLANVGSLAGFSFGFGLKINRFRIDYGRTTYHTAGGVNHLGIMTSINAFK